MSETTRLLKHVQRSAAVVTDGDRTAWKSNAAEHGIGIPYIKKAIRTFHWVTATRGLQGYFEIKIKSMLRGNPGISRDSAAGLKLFYDKLIANGLRDAKEMRAFAYNYIVGHRVKIVWELVTGHEQRYLISCNGSIVAGAANQIFSFTNFASNRDIITGGAFEGYKLSGVNLQIRTGEDKERAVSNMLRKRGIRLNECFVIGDSDTDEPMLKEAKFAAAAPFATERIKALPGIICLEDKSLLDPKVMLESL